MKASNVALIILTLLIGANIYFTFALQERIKAKRQLDYPLGTKNVKELGNGWTTFRFRVGGRSRLFLRHVFTDGSSEALTELVNAPEERVEQEGNSLQHSRDGEIGDAGQEGGSGSTQESEVQEEGTPCPKEEKVKTR